MEIPVPLLFGVPEFGLPTAFGLARPLLFGLGLLPSVLLLPIPLTPPLPIVLAGVPALEPLSVC